MSRRPERHLQNPPGQDRLRFRVGTQGTFLADLLDRMKVQQLPDGPRRGAAPLANLNLELEGNWVRALLRAWAMVGDVLSFYQERIANEGTLGTATELVSLRELLYTVGYRPRPGAAAVTHLSFHVSGARGMPEEVTVPRGARVQSLPVGGRPPQLFETDEPLAARAEWNRVEPRVPRIRRRPPLVGAATGVKLAGLKTSLGEGSSLLLLGELADPAARCWWRTVVKVEPRPLGGRPKTALERLLESRTGGQGPPVEPPATDVDWGEPLDPNRADAEVVAPRVFWLAGRASLFGHEAPEWNGLPLEVRRRYRPLAGGVSISPDGGGSWRQANDNLPPGPVHALATGVGGLLFAATSAGVFRAVDDGPWKLLESLAGQAVKALATDDDGTVWAGTATGDVLRSGDGGDAWEPISGQPADGPVRRLAGRLARRPPRRPQLPKGPIHVLLAVPSLRGTRLLAGTDKGIFSTRDRDDGWRPLNRGLPGEDAKTGLAGLAVKSLALDSTGALWAGTPKGAFRARRPGRRWRPLNRGLPGVHPKTGLAAAPVTALAAYDDRRARRRRLVAGTAAGIFHRSGPRGTWRPAGEGLGAELSVAALAVRPDPHTLTHELWAATASGLVRSTDHGETWVPADPSGTAQPMTTVTVGRDGEVIAAAPFGGFAEDEWPGFHLRGRAIDLASVVPQIVPGGWIVLTQSAGQTAEQDANEPPPRVGIYRVISVDTVRRSDFLLDTLVTRVVADRDDGLSAFDLRRTVVHCLSEELELWNEEVPLLQPLDAEQIELEPMTNPLEVGRPVVVTGRALRLTLAAGSPPATLRQAEGGGAGVEIRPGDVLTLTTPVRDRGEWLTLAVRHPDAGEGTIEVPSGDVRWLPAAGEAEPLAQLTRVAGFTLQSASRSSPGDGTRVSTVTLDPPLAHGLDPTTTAVLANVARASQGETVVEHLDGGEASRAHRSLTLAKPPLTYLPASNPRGAVSTLEVRVGGVRWHEVPSLRAAGPRDRVYVVRQDLEGRPHLVFGDDDQGARLPQGHGNVDATYRSGLWTDPLPAGHLNLLQTRPLGLQAATNPLPVQGATPPELLERGRARAPRSTRVLGRIVSLPDCEDFVASFPGVERTRLARLTTDDGPLVHLTVAGPGGNPVEGAVMARLVEAVASLRVPGPRVRIDSYQRVSLVLAARLRPDPDDLPGRVTERVRDHLASALGFPRSRWGQRLTAAEIIAGIQEVPGVVEVELTAFHAAGTDPGVATALRADPAHWDAATRTVQPAQLLVLDPPTGLRLEVIQAP